jgi:hypothetical protein
MYGFHRDDTGTFEGWTDAGDTIRFTVSSPSESYYNVYLEYSSDSDKRAVQLQVNGQTLSTDSLPFSGGAGAAAEEPVGEIKIPAGINTVSFVSLDGQIDFYTLRFENNNATHTDCAGQLDGTAFLDKCGTCVGGNTGLTPCVVTANLKNQDRSFHVYPNPFETYLMIDAAEGTPVELYTVTGVKVWEGTVRGGRVLPAAAPGTYMLKVNVNDGAEVKMLTKLR